MFLSIFFFLNCSFNGGLECLLISQVPFLGFITPTKSLLQAFDPTPARLAHSQASKWALKAWRKTKAETQRHASTRKPNKTTRLFNGRFSLFEKKHRSKNSAKSEEPLLCGSHEERLRQKGNSNTWLWRTPL